MNTSPKRFRDTTSFGKRQEYVVTAEFLRRGFEVFQTLVGDQGIDCVIRHEDNDELRYLGIQIKARSKECQPRNAGCLAGIGDSKPTAKLLFRFLLRAGRHLLGGSIRGSRRLANQNKSGFNKGCYSINFCYAGRDGTVTRRLKFRLY